MKKLYCRFVILRFYCSKPNLKVATFNLDTPRICSLLQILIPESATEALLRVAVLPLELDERLAVGGILHGEAAGPPVADDGIVLGLELLQKVEGTLTNDGVVLVRTVGEEERAEGIEDEKVPRGVRKLIFFKG